MTKRKKPAPPPAREETEGEAPPDEALAAHADAPAEIAADEADLEQVSRVEESAREEDADVDVDVEATVNLVGDLPLMPGRDDLDEPTLTVSGGDLEEVDRVMLQRKHLRGLVEALVFASDSPIKPSELAKLASAPAKLVKELLGELKQEYATRGIHLDEVANGWVFRTSAQYAPFIRDLTKQKPVRLSRAQVETLAIIAYRQPITRPEIDDVRGVDSGPVLKVLLERDLVRILGKRDEPGRPLIYGTTTHFLEFFGLRSLKDLPTLREFTELTDESREKYEEELGETPGADGVLDADAAREPHDTFTSETSEPSEHDEAPPKESMRVPAGDEADEPAEPEAHPADDDGPTLSETPAHDAPSEDEPEPIE